ncbi:hypothetical protein ABT297_31460 [Dactylosporangium sp. NPDC000555]|uniref:hypothetical protein n=1 Tax=Dactylosporangium sp. NPDC000555 TaxID=3154260 RepID=UPI00331866C6
MSGIGHEHIAAAPPGTPAAEVLRQALLAVGRFAVEHRELLTGLRMVVLQSSQLRSSNPGVRPDQEAAFVAELAARDGAEGSTGWRLRLLVACALAGFRVWYEEYLRDAPADPLTHLEEILRAACPPAAA